MVPLIGYADRLSARPGETIEFKVSSTGAEPYEARLVRVFNADPNPAGPGLLETPVAAAFEGHYPSREQPIRLGSFARIADPAPLDGLESLCLNARIWPTLPEAGRQAILARFDPETGRGFALLAEPQQGATLWIGHGAGHFTALSVGRPLKERTWYRVWAGLEAETGRLLVGQAPLGPAARLEDPAIAESRLESPAQLGEAGDLLIAALDGPSQHFNGKIEAPAIHDRFSAQGGLSEPPSADPGDPVAQWDFALDTQTTRIIDLGRHGLHGQLVNFPARGMTGSTWEGAEHCWRHAPQDYGAIHFHADDICDAGWETDFSFTLPDDLRSGVYAVRLACGRHEDTIPFFVCPPKGQAMAEVCLVVPTFTYAIYGNHARLDFSRAWRDRASEWSAYPHNPADHPEYGLSTYNQHGDGSGICHASHLRPLMTLKQGFLTFAEPEGRSGLRHYQADCHIVAWLQAKGFDCDILTDLELHNEGAEVLHSYKAVLTGTHPEYHTTETLDALEGYRDGGGRLAYLGGNGFYWRVALHGERPGVIEIRRGEGGIRAWAAEPGEYYNAFDGAYGGLWRRNGRPPQRLAGVGFSAQGTFEGGHYRRRPVSYESDFAWIFEGIDDEILGDFGFCGGGAAGFELDRADRRLGSPEATVILASSEGHSDNFVLVPEEILTHRVNWPGEATQDLIRADMTYFELPGGGAVFSVGSITFCGSLLSNGADNNISKLLENVLKGFLKG